MSPGDVRDASSSPSFQRAQNRYSFSPWRNYSAAETSVRFPSHSRRLHSRRPSCAPSSSLKDAARSFATQANASAPFGNSYPGTQRSRERHLARAITCPARRFFSAYPHGARCLACFALLTLNNRL